MNLEIISRDSLFSKLPRDEVHFLLENAGKVLSRLKDDSLESLLRQISGVFSDKEYGWEEAILDGRWYRYPSEVKKQRFCSEEALKNFLLLRTLGIPVTYAVVDNYNNRGMYHEVNLVPDGSRLWLVEWEISPVRVNRKSFEKDDGRRIPFDNIIYLTEDEILERVKALRSGNSFLDAIQSGQILYTKEFPEGELMAFVQYNPQQKEIYFLYQLTKMPGGINFYFLDKLMIQNGNIVHNTEQGIIKGRNIGTDRIPLLSFETDGICKDDIGRVIDSLDNKTRWRIGTQNIYDTQLVENEFRGWKFSHSKSQRQKALRKMRSNQSDKYAGFLKDYDTLRKKSVMSAERYLDFALFNAGLTSHFRNQEGMNSYFRKSYGFDASYCLGLLFSLINIKDLGCLIPIDDICNAQQRLWQALCQRHGIPQSRYSPSETLKYTTKLAGILNGVLDNSIQVTFSEGQPILHYQK